MTCYIVVVCCCMLLYRSSHAIIKNERKSTEPFPNAKGVILKGRQPMENKRWAIRNEIHRNPNQCKELQGKPPQGERLNGQGFWSKGFLDYGSGLSGFVCPPIVEHSLLVWKEAARAQSPQVDWAFEEHWDVDLLCRARSPQPVWDISPYLEAGGSRAVASLRFGW